MGVNTAVAEMGEQVKAQNEPLIYNHNGVLIVITEDERFWNAELRDRNKKIIGYVSAAKVGEDHFGRFLDQCGSTIEKALEPSVKPPRAPEHMAVGR